MQTLMLKNRFKKVGFGFAFLCGSFGFSQSFNQDASAVLSDVVLLSKGFVSSAADASVYQSSSAWYSSAKSVGKFKVDFSIHANVLPIPKSQKNFEVSNTDFQSMEIRGGAQSVSVPTALGGDTNAFFDFKIVGQDYEMQAFEGVDESFLAHPYVQASVGLWAATDISFRYSPKVKIDVSDYQILGGAIKHNLTQYTRKEGSEKSLEIAVLLSYSKFDLDLYFDEFKLEATNPQPGSTPLAVVNSIIVDANSWLFQFIASKEYKKFEFSGSLGVTRNDFKYELGGDEGLFLDLFNQALTTLDEENKIGFKGDVGVNYHFKKFYLSSMVSLGKFANCNLALHYKI
ncbi:MAG: hypothetical protein HRT69_10135 [Flavobacteriaceae bacterium]|nr:hypothetical protein [Flavobacteriaceae bacterium]